MDAHVFADNGSYGVLYSKDLQLLCRRPWNGSAWYPFVSRPTMQAASAYVDKNATLFIVALVLQARAGYGGYNCLAAAIGGDSTQTQFLGNVKMPLLRQQPWPQMFPAGDSVGVGIVLNWGSYTSNLVDGDSVGMANGDAGAFILMHLLMEEGKLRAIPTASATLPSHPDLRFVRSFVLLHNTGAWIATSATRVQLIAPFESTTALQQISSAQGSGTNAARPRLQSLSLANDNNLLVWIDATGANIGFDLANNTSSSQHGGNILAHTIHHGRMTDTNVPGFPIVTNAQCIALQRLGGQPVLAWARVSDSWKGKRRLPNGICVRVLSEL